MPNFRLFAWSQAAAATPHLPALPRTSDSPRIGSFVKLVESSLKNSAAVEGVLDVGDIGVVVEDTGSATTPFLVQELVSGRISWYTEGVLEPVPQDDVPDGLLHNHPDDTSDGCYVTLAPDYRQQSDAADGPLSLLRPENVYGYVFIAHGGRCRVRSCLNGSEWWYDHEALRTVHLCYVPEVQRAIGRPLWGEYVGLAAHHTQFGSAANGPLSTSELGLVVSVHHAPDCDGGLMKECYTVRKCRTGQLFDYMEGALHLVPSECISNDRVPPSTGSGRAQKLDFTIKLLQAGTGVPMPSGSVLSSEGDMQQVQAVVPGQEYWIQATMTSKDEDVFLAALQPSAWHLYGPSGQPGQYVHLKPTATPQQSSKVWTSELPGMRSKLLPLQHCSGAGGSRHGDVAVDDDSGSECVMYDTTDDKIVCTFEWNSGETPLALVPGRLTEVTYIAGVSFRNIPGVFRQPITLLLKTQTSSPTSPPEARGITTPEFIHLNGFPTTPTPDRTSAAQAAPSTSSRSDVHDAAAATYNAASGQHSGERRSASRSGAHSHSGGRNGASHRTDGSGRQGGAHDSNTTRHVANSDDVDDELLGSDNVAEALRRMLGAL